MRSIIFANGDLHPQENTPEIAEGDLLIAADGGSRHCYQLDLIPDVLIGDLDSTKPDLVHAWEGIGVEVLRHPEDKDQTDLELALLYAQAQGANKIVVYGAVGGRLDMTFGNLILLANPSLKSLVKMVYGKEEIRLLHEGDLLTLPGNKGDTVSLIALDPKGAQVTTNGLEFPLEKEILEFGFTRGISNRLVNNQGTIHLHKGLLAVIHSRQPSQEE